MTTLAVALRQANLPTVVAVLAHLTGDDRWLADPFLPTRPRGLDDNDTGGFSDEVREVILGAAETLIPRYAECPPARRPTGDRMASILSAAVAEAVGPEYGEMLLYESGFEPEPPAPTRTGLRAVVVGAGASGLAAASELDRAGIDSTVLEKDAAVGGTWYENRYPGCGCDTPSHLYCFREDPNAAGWSRYYAGGSEIGAYLAGIASRRGLDRHVHCGVEVTQSVWQRDTQEWLVHTRSKDGSQGRLRADAVINATGMLSRPSVPDLPGLDEFQGPVTHTARWPEDLDVTGKQVVVVGTGASAMQLVPAIAGRAAHVTVIQRSPQWAIPNPNYRRTVTAEVSYLMKHVPYYAQWYRLRLLWLIGDRLHPALQLDPDWEDRTRSINKTNDSVRRFLTRYIIDQLGDRADELGERATPDYPPFGKRMLMDNGWFATVAHDDVSLVAGAVDRVSAHAVRTVDGHDHPADVLVLATGFQSRNYLGTTDYIGVGGISLHETWGPDDARAYLGMTIPGFPNLFFMYGPNTNPVSGSVLTHSEYQARYAALLLRKMAEEGISSVDCRRDVFEQYIQRVDDAHRSMVWTHPRVHTYYRNAAGRVVNSAPWRQVDYFQMTRTPALNDYVVQRRAGPSARNRPPGRDRSS